MNDESIRKSLESIARRSVPENTNLWPRLAARIERKDTVVMQPKWKLAWVILLALLGLSAVTGVAYAFYRYINDPGLQSVSDAGLISTVNATSLPEILPTATPPAPVTAIGESQILEGVTLTLDWIYLMDGQQAFGFSVSGLSDDRTLDLPVMTFGLLNPQQYRGAGMAIKDDIQPAAGVFVVNQIVRDAATYGQTETHTDVGIDIPLLDANGRALNTFRFEIADEIVHDGPYGGGNVYSTRANGLEIDLDWLLLTSRSIQARLCFLPPDGKDWSLTAPTIQVGADPGQVAAATPIAASALRTVNGEEGFRCQQVIFPVNAMDAQAFFLSIEGLSTSSGETMHGAWQFNWNELPGRMQFPGIAPLAAPLASQALGIDLDVTLDRAYADAARMIFVLSFNGRPGNVSVFNTVLKDSAGNDLNTGMGISSPPDDPSRYILEFDAATEFPAGPFHGSLWVDVTPPGSSDTAQVHFDLDLTVYPALVLDPMQEVTAGGVTILLQRVKATPSFTQAYLCYQAPSAGDWAPGYATTLQNDNATASLYSYGLLSDSQMGYTSKVPEPGWTAPSQAGRCVKLGFPFGYQAGSETLTLTIPRLEQSVPEAIPDDQLQAARQELLAQGIDMDWVISTGQGGGGASLVVNSKPEGMTDDQVMQLFYEALGYYYPGPWTFTVNINP